MRTGRRRTSPVGRAREEHPERIGAGVVGPLDLIGIALESAVEAPGSRNLPGMVPVLAVVMAVGAVGTVVPLVPGISLVWAAGLVYGLDRGFGAVGAPAFAVMTGLALAGAVTGYVVPKRRASRAGATRATVWLGVVGAVGGFFVVPVVGLPLGGALGIFVGERLRTGDTAAAYRATRETIVGFGLATLLQLAAALSMIAVWVLWVIAG